MTPVRIAAVGDLHAGPEMAGRLRPNLADLGERADVLLLAGDLTHVGRAEEAEVVAAELGDLGVPVVAVLGNHDHHVGEPGKVREVMEAGGATVLEGESTTLDVGGRRVGVAGVKGFGGGFVGACATAFGEAEMKAFVEHTAERSEQLREQLTALNAPVGDGGADVVVALLHYSPVEDTLRGERPEIYPFLGSYLLAEAVDDAGADLVVHGHAHQGAERGRTAKGVPVRNVAVPVIHAAYKVYRLAAR